MQRTDISAALSPWEPGLLALMIYSIMVIGLIAILLFLCSFLGRKILHREKLLQYESGITPTGIAQILSPAPFYLVAIFFLIFDVEAAFIFSWAVSFYRLGWVGWIQMTFFILLLLFGLFYVWKKGGLNWQSKESEESCSNTTSS